MYIDLISMFFIMIMGGLIGVFMTCHFIIKPPNQPKKRYDPQQYENDLWD